MEFHKGDRVKLNQAAYEAGLKFRRGTLVRRREPNVWIVRWDGNVSEQSIGEGFLVPDI